MFKIITENHQTSLVEKIVFNCELGFSLHIPNKKCTKLEETGKKFTFNENQKEITFGTFQQKCEHEQGCDTVQVQTLFICR